MSEEPHERATVPGEARVFTATDPLGREVVLTEKQRDHIHEEHPEVRVLDMRQAIETAQVRVKGAFEGAELLWARNFGPSRWLVVVVAYSGSSGRVVTAYGTKKGPPSQNRL